MGSMSDVVIRAEGLGKRYRIGSREASYKTLRESLTGLALAPARRFREFLRGAPLRREPETIWALKDIDLQVRRGEVLGVIGRNGAGKSTLLKILARITEPTTGRVELRGRVGSLLEVGTGFHPELTGRENIYLNGAILGMRKTEITRKFDEIVAFAEVERFLDTPVKRYSSGMYVRLAFGVAAFLEPEILLVDEVLAVGDSSFQSKCIGKMSEFAHGGRTVLFVSHNVGAISSFTSRSIQLGDGRIVADGPSRSVVEQYVSTSVGTLPTIEADLVSDRCGSGPCRISRVVVAGTDGLPRSEFLMGEPLRVIFDLEAERPVRGVVLAVVIESATGVPVLHCVSVDSGFELAEWTGAVQVAMQMDSLMVYPGDYVMSFWVGDGHGHDADYLRSCLKIHVQQGFFLSSRALYYAPTNWKLLQGRSTTL